MNKSELFRTISIETSSYCNRTCPTCIRNSYPNRDRVSSWFGHRYLFINTIRDILTQAIEIGFTGDVCLSHYNEPLLDYRIDEIAEMARTFPQFKSVYFHTNGDYMTETFASELDGKLNKIVVSLYMDEPRKSERGKWIQSLFKQTKIDLITNATHLTTHFSPRKEIQNLISKHSEGDCKLPVTTCIINHRRQYLLCCEDLVGEFDLGTFPETSLKDYWFGEKHMGIVNTLLSTGSRKCYPYCAICPKD